MVALHCTARSVLGVVVDGPRGCSGFVEGRASTQLPPCRASHPVFPQPDRRGAPHTPCPGRLDSLPHPRHQRNLLVHRIPDVDGNRGPAASRDSLCCFLDASSGSELSSNGHPSIGCRPSAHLARRTPYAQVVPQWMSDGCGCDPETSPRWHLHRMTDVRDLPVSVFLLAADMIDEEVSSQLFVP